jgi:hypothetical protein
MPPKEKKTARLPTKTDKRGSKPRRKKGRVSPRVCVNDQEKQVAEVMIN